MTQNQNPEINCLELEFSADDCHDLAKSHIEAMKRELDRGNVEDVLYHLTVAKALLRPSSHRHPEVAKMIELIEAEPEKVHHAVTTHRPELTIEEASLLLNSVLGELSPHQTQMVRPVHADGYYWELELFFSSPSQMRYVTVTHAIPGAKYPLLYELIDYYSSERSLHLSIDGIVDRLSYLINN